MILTLALTYLSQKTLLLLDPPPRRALGVTWTVQNIEELRAEAYISSSWSTPEHKKDLKEI
jgi:hypothetical protein